VENADALDQLDLLFGQTVIGQISPLLVGELSRGSFGSATSELN
jgi:hypothetical protein